MGNTRNTGYLQNIVQYDASNNITLPARLAVTGTVAVNNTTPYDTTQFSLDVNGGLIVKNINKTAQFVLINSNPATGGNNAFVVHTVGGTSGSSYADIQGYYGTSIAGSTVIRLNPQGGNVLVGSLAGTGSRMVVASATGVLSTQAIVTLGDLSGVPTSRTITINGTTQDLSANRTFTIDSMVYPGAGIAVSTGTAWGTSLTDNSSNWNTAYGWGNHAGLYSLLNHVHTIANVTGLQTALDGKEPTITAGTNLQYWRGDKTWQTLPSYDLSLYVPYVGATSNLNLGYASVLPSSVYVTGSSATQSGILAIKHNASGSSTGTYGYTSLYISGTRTLGISFSETGDTRLVKFFAGSLSANADLTYTLPNASGTIALTSDLSTYATESYVGTQIANLVASSPAALDTLNELAAALGNDAAFSTTVSTALGNRLRVDINTQGLSATLQGYGRTNLGLGTAATSNTGDFAAASHTHSIANVTGLQTALDGKQASGSYAAATHSHIISDVTGLQTALDGKQASLGYTPYNSTNPSGYITSSGSITGTAGSTGLLTIDNSVVYGRSGLQFAQSANTAGNTASNHNTPTADWWHVIRMNHANGGGYYADLAVSMTTNLGLSRRVISNGAQLSNWVTILDALNYNSYSPTLTGTGASGSWGISITGNAATSTIFNNGSLYISVTNGNTLNSGYNNAGDGSDIWINYRGYNDAQSYFRDFRVGDGKGAQVALFTGSTKSLAITGTISASNLSGTNTGDQTNISGNAATATTATNALEMANNGNSISGMGSISNWDSRPGVGFAAYGINNHTGVTLSGYGGYGGVRLYASGYPTHASSVLRLEASDSVKTFGGLYSDGNPVLVQNTSISYSFGLNDSKLYLRTNGDNNHYLWNNASDFEEMVYYNGTGFKVTSSTGVSTCVFESVASSGMLFIGSADASRTYIGDASRSGIAIGGTAYPQLMLNAVGGGNTTHGANISMTGLKSAGGYRRWVMGIPNLDPTTFSLGWADDQSNPHYGVGVGWGASAAKFSWDTSGNFIASGDITAYGTPSDLRLKDLKGKVSNALSSIIKLNGYRFDWKEDKSKLFVLKEDIGVIAQEVADVFPELARTNDDGFMSVRYQGLTAVLIEAMKEQQTQIESQKSEIDELKDLVKQLINR